jgi:hypothetical protein
MLKHRAFKGSIGSLGSPRPKGVVTVPPPWIACAYPLTFRHKSLSCHKTKTLFLIISESIFCRCSIFAACPLVVPTCVRRFASDRPSSVRSDGCGSLSHPHRSACWAEGSRSGRGVGGKENKTLPSSLCVPLLLLTIQLHFYQR